MPDEQFGIVVKWYDVPDFDGGGTCVRIENGKEVLHWLVYHDTCHALEAVRSVLAAHKLRFRNAKPKGV